MLDNGTPELECQQFGCPIDMFRVIADRQTEFDAARTLMWPAAWVVFRGQDALCEISMAKLMSSETYAKMTNMGMQISGAHGYGMEFDMQRHFRDSHASAIAAGSSQIQRGIIARLMA